jgi:ribose transport system ATP-binding protein
VGGEALEVPHQAVARVRLHLHLHRGEVLGIAGLVGAWRTELLRTLFGLDAMRGGCVRIHGVSIGYVAPFRSLSRGVGLLSEDRAMEGLALSRSISDNLLLSRLQPLGRWGFVSPAAMRRAARHWIDRMGIRCRSSEQMVRELSGGNQQKVALARLLHHDVDILLLDEPTRGVDVGSKAQIYQQISALAAAGKAVLVVSSYMPELLGICDRIAVMHRGRVVETRAAEQWSQHDLITVAAGGTTDSEPR